MRRILPILIAATVLGVAASSAYLAPLYPVYAQTVQTSTASGPAFMRAPKAVTISDEQLKNRGEEIMKLDRPNLASRSAALTEKLAKFKDRNKAKRVETINENLNKINTQAVTQMSTSLQRISQVLEKLKALASKGQAGGINVSALNSAIADVEVQWAEADTALKAQTETDYSISVNSESTVKQDAMISRNALRTDLQAARGQVVKTRQSLVNAIQAALTLLQEGNNGSK